MTLQDLTLIMLQSLFLHKEHVLRRRFALDGVGGGWGPAVRAAYQTGQP
jgi:hypothetical protein